MTSKRTKFVVAATVIALIFTLALLFKGKLISSEKNSTEVSVPPDTTAVAASAQQPERRRIQAPTTFPEYGNRVEDFIQSPYELVMESRGLLNDDDLEDVVLVLQNKTDSTDLRPTLVLFKKADGSYELNAKSLTAIGPAYINGDFKQYDSESVKIDSGMLSISTYSISVVGNRETKYKFVNGQLILTYMETYNMGAGGQTGVVYDFINQTIKVTDVNTMKEDMPSTEETTDMKAHKPYLFNDIDPTEIM